jgi:hypothetical protein
MARRHANLGEHHSVLFCMTEALNYTNNALAAILNNVPEAANYFQTIENTPL